MKKLLIRTLKQTVIASCVLAIAILLTSATTHAQIFNPGAKAQACQGVSTAGCDPNPAGHINNTLTNFVNIFSVIIGIVTVIMVIMSGFKFITSGGDPQGVASAKGTLMYALIGAAVVAMSQVLVHFVLFHSK